ncbi:thiamine pyrophosphokinase [Pasteurella langaaensis DSM 22999]|uniref:Thiamine diphosphokinase n=1 Tax=Alitibacter langaaensis DSM 22999 TaxID=1122935 RepID=A0A2U0TGM3_9PAST|nr:thiamine diphosphokinase [Pasteurella langaaensis]PVX42762.1 thiamine pyrophosphokinase [Pasteurella langaaensis DSM 22999]
MTNIAFIAGGEFSPLQNHYDFYVGIDRGCLFLLNNGLPLDFAIGDFDSISAADLAKIQQATKHFIQAPTAKNDTDTELALKTIFAQYPQAKATIYGGFGGRLDHLLANVFLPSDPELAPFMQQISLIDGQNVVSYAPSGLHRVKRIDNMKYVSFMTDGNADLTILNAKYDLTPSNFFKKKIYSSNEFIGDFIDVSVDSGYVVIIQTKDRE